MNKKLKERNINVITNEYVNKIESDCVVFESGNKFMCNVPVWCTGTEPQQVTIDSDLETLRGYFRVNDYLQSTSHPNVFAGGDCITMESFNQEQNIFPHKAGFYAIQEGPVIAENIVNMIKRKPLVEYKPYPEFLCLMTTGDGSCVGTKFGIAFTGKWVWLMKDYLDRNFMK